jgi:HAE1 family hydrophobic/amphiphilic exporter-1
MSLPRLSVNNKVIVHLLLAATLIGGVFSGFTLVREMFPESRPNLIVVETPYPGATPLEVERGISARLEEAIKDIEFIDKIETKIAEGSSRILVELTSDVKDLDAKVNEIRSAIDAIPRDELPLDAEETRVAKFEPRLPVISVTVFGDKDEHSLKLIGRKLRDEILLLPNITNVVAGGIRKAELSVEVVPEKLIEYGLSMSDVAAAIRGSNLDLPAGQIKSAGQNIAVRTLGETDDVYRIAETIVRTTPEGKIVRVRDLARVDDAFEDVDITARYNGQPCVDITVYKAGDQDAVDIAAKVKAYVAGKTHQPFEPDWKTWLAEAFGRTSELRKIYDDAANNPFPSDVQLEVHSNLANYIEGRLKLLTDNSLQGLALVGVSLLLFLNWRVALWAMMGVLFSIAGTAILMKVMGESLNLISMFGLLVVMGILVDDAIIIGENIYSRVEAGEEPKEAAIKGTEEVQGPVVICVLTTMAAFAPLMFVEGQIGQFFKVLPIVAIFALGTSLIEALTMLPTHLAHSLKRPQPGAPRPQGWFTSSVRRISGAASGVFDHYLGPVYARALRFVVTHRYVALCGLIASMMFTMGLVLTRDRAGGIAPGGRVPFVFVQKMDSETVMANLVLPVGSPMELTSRILHDIETTLLDREAFPEVKNVFSLIGAQIEADEGGIAADVRSHAAQAIIELQPTDQRDRTSDEIMIEMRKRVGMPPGVETLKFAALYGGPSGAEIDIEIRGDDQDALLAIAEVFKEKLATYEGVFDIGDDFEDGRRELRLTLLDSALPLGVNTEWLAREIRAAFFGLEARTLQRDREDVDIRVRLPMDRRRSVADLEQLRIVTPAGAAVPLCEIAKVEEGTGFSSLRRVNQQRCVRVTADVDQAVTRCLRT